MGMKPGYVFMTKADNVTDANYKAYLKKKAAYDRRPLAGLDKDNGVEEMHHPWYLVRAKSKNSLWRLALIEMKPERDRTKRIRIDERDKSILILKTWPDAFRGRTGRSAFAVNASQGRLILQKLKTMNIHGASLLKAAGYFDQLP